MKGSLNMKSKHYIIKDLAASEVPVRNTRPFTVLYRSFVPA